MKIISAGNFLSVKSIFLFSKFPHSLLKSFAFLLSFLLLMNMGWGQSFTGTYNFANVTTTSGTTDPTSVPTATGVTFGSFSSSFGSNPAAAGRFAFSGWPLAGNAPTSSGNATCVCNGAINTGSYLQFSITVAAGYSLSLSTITFTMQRSNTGCRQYAVRSNADSYVANLPASINSNTNLTVAATNIFQVTDASNSAENGSTISLSGSNFTNLASGTTRTFRFYGWNAEASGGTFGIDNVVISGTASAIPTSYTVTFNANGGSGTMANQTASVPTALTSNAFTRSDYTFTGWATSAGGSVVYADGASYPFTSSTTLFAQWTLNASPVLAISGTPTNHGTVCVNTSGSSIQYTITNNGSVAAENVSVSSNNAEFAVSGLSSTSIPVSGTATFNVTFTPTSTGGTSKSATISVTSTTSGSNNPTLSLTGTRQDAITPSVSITSSSSVCSNQSITFTPTPSNLGGGTASYSWTVDGTAGTATGNSYIRSSWTSTANSVQAVMTVTGGTCLSSTTASSNTFNPSAFTIAVTPAVSITSSSAVCANQSITFTPSPSNLGGGTASYSWTVDGTAGTATGSPYTRSSWSSTSNSVQAVMTVSGGCVTSTTVNSNTFQPTVVNAVPAQPGVITQPSSICAGTTGNVFSVTNDPAVTYTWSVSGTGWAIPSASTTNSVTVTAGSGAGSVSVIANQNGCQSTSRSTGSITPSSAPGTPNAITGISSAVCSNSSGITISTSATGSPTSYTWTLPAGFTTNNSTTSSLNITGFPTSSSGGYNISVAASNNCGTGNARTGTLTVNQPISITSQPVNTTACSETDIVLNVSAANVSGHSWKYSSTAGFSSTLNLANSLGGNTPSATLDHPNYNGWDGKYFRCDLTALSGCANTSTNVVQVRAYPQVGINLSAQTTIFSENFGTGSGTTLSSTTQTSGWSNPAGTGSTRLSANNATSAASSAYTGASGGSNIISGCSSTSTNLDASDNSLVSPTINTTGYGAITVSWGARATSSYPWFTDFQYSVDNGNNWISLLFIDVASNSTWSLVNNGTPIVLPASCNNITTLKLRWIIPFFEGSCTSPGNYRIDDIVIKGIPTSSLTVCNNAASYSLAYSGTAQSPNLYSINYDATSIAAGFSSISNQALSGSPITIPMPSTSVAAGNYNATLRVINSSTGCSTDYSYILKVNAAPVVYNVTGGGSYCSGGTGVAVGLSNSESGVNYQLVRGGSTNVGSPVSGTGAALSFGNQTVSGTYTVVATNSITNCTATMNSSASVTINPLPNVYNVSGGGAYCSGGVGVNVSLSGSQTGVNYTTFIGGVATGNSQSGTGNGFSFTGQTNAGIYTIVATTTNNCTATMTGSATVVVNPLPVAYSVTGTGSYCPGGSGLAVGLSNSQAGTNYQLIWNGVNIGSPVSGTGSALSFGTQTEQGTYTVSAINTVNSPNCSATMSGSAVVSIASKAAVQLGSSTPLFTQAFTSGLPSGWSISSPAGSQFDWSVNSTAASSGYTGASGGNNFISRSSALAANTTTVSRLISSAYNIAGYSNISVIWGARKTSSYNANGRFYYSTDGNTWNEIQFSDVAANSTWALVNGGVPLNVPDLSGASTIYFRWDAQATTDFSNYRIDDIAIYGLQNFNLCNTSSATNVIYTSSANSTGYTLTSSGLAGNTTQTGTLNTNGGTLGISIPTGTAGGNYNFNLTLSNGNGCSTSYIIPINLSNPTLSDLTIGSGELCNGSVATVNVTGILNVPQTINYTIGAISGTASVTGVGGSASFNTVALNATNSNQHLTITGITRSDVNPGCSANFSLAKPIPSIFSGSKWIGGVSAQWENPANWCGAVPTSATDIIIPTIGASPIISSQEASVRNLTILGNDPDKDKLTINNGQILKVSGIISVTSAGQIVANNGTIELNGNSAQDISASMFRDKNIYNLKLSNNSGVNITGSDTLKLLNKLSFGASNATLTTNGKLTLVSNATRTASVGEMGSNNAVNGNVIVERFINTGTAAGQHGKSWQLISIPITGNQTIKSAWQEDSTFISGYGTILTSNRLTAKADGFDFYTRPGASIKNWNGATQTWEGPVSTRVPISDKRGYMVFVRGDRSITNSTTPANQVKLRTTGNLYQPNNPPSTIEMTNPGFHSVGNPYASAIDFGQLSSSNVAESFIVFDPNLRGTYGVGGYQTMSRLIPGNPATPFVASPGGTSYFKSYFVDGGNTDYGRILSGQAFFVTATSNVSNNNKATLSFNESAKVDENTRLAFRPAANSLSILGSYLLADFGTDMHLADGNRVVFADKYSDNVDGYDAVKMTNGGENFGLMCHNRLLAVEARSNIKILDTLKFYMSNLKAMNYKLCFVPENLSSQDVVAELVDKYLNTRSIVSMKDTTYFSFSVNNDAASNAPDRFILVFNSAIAGTVPVTFTSITANRNREGKIDVGWKTENEVSIKSYELERSSNGRSFDKINARSAVANNGSNAEYSYLDEAPLQGVNFYRIKALSENGQIQYSAIVKVTTINEAPAIAVFPNPVRDGKVNIRFTNKPAGNYTVQMSNSIGQIIYSSRWNVEAGNNIRTIDISPRFKPSASPGIYQLRIFSEEGESEVLNVQIVK